MRDFQTRQTPLFYAFSYIKTTTELTNTFSSDCRVSIGKYLTLLPYLISHINIIIVVKYCFVYLAIESHLYLFFPKQEKET